MKNVNCSYKWDSSKLNLYKNALNSNVFQENLTIIENNVNNATTGDDINNNLKDFYQIIDDTCGFMFKKQNNSENKTRNNNHDNKQKWYDLPCKESQGEFYSKLSMYRLNKTDENRQFLTRARTNYKT